MSNTFLNWTSRVDFAGRVAERRRPHTGTSRRYQRAITTCRSTRLKPGQKPQSGSGSLNAASHS